MKPIAIEDVVYLGRSGRTPALTMWADPLQSKMPVDISLMSQGYSVYALAVSPDGSRVASGTRTGLLQVHGLVDYRGTANSKPLFDMFHPPAATSIDFCTNDLLASGGLDGKIKIWSITEKSLVAELDGHPGGVLALCRIGSLLLASLGRDATLRIWDLDSLEARFTQTGIALPKVQALTCLTYARKIGLLIHPSQTGEFYVYDSAADFSMKTISAHRGDFCALAYGDGQLASSGLADARLKIWNSDLSRVQMEASTGTGIVAIGWVGSRSLLTIDINGNGQLWNTQGSLAAGPRLQEGNLRVCHGLPGDLITLTRINADREWRDAKIEEARECMGAMDPETQQRLRRIVEELDGRGFSAEASLVIADAAKAQDRLLWELESRLTFIGGMEEGPDILPSMYALAHLLAKVCEPELAVEYFERIRNIQPKYRDTDQMVTELQSHPLIGLTPNDTVRGDFSQPEHVLQEIEKFSVLERPFAWPVLFKSKQGVIFHENLEAKAIHDAIRTELDRILPGKHGTTLKKLKLYRKTEIREADWVLVTQSKSKLPVSYALEVRAVTLGCEAVPHALFDVRLLEPDKKASSKKNNKKVADIWNAVQNSTEVQQWLNDINGVVLAAVRQLRDRCSVEKDAGMF
jgi:hypothetical protein